MLYNSHPFSMNLSQHKDVRYISLLCYNTTVGVYARYGPIKLRFNLFNSIIFQRVFLFFLCITIQETLMGRAGPG